MTESDNEGYRVQVNDVKKHICILLWIIMSMFDYDARQSSLLSWNSIWVKLIQCMNKYIVGNINDKMLQLSNYSNTSTLITIYVIILNMHSIVYIMWHITMHLLLDWCSIRILIGEWCSIVVDVGVEKYELKSCLVKNSFILVPPNYNRSTGGPEGTNSYV